MPIDKISDTTVYYFVVQAFLRASSPQEIQDLFLKDTFPHMLIQSGQLIIRRINCHTITRMIDMIAAMLSRLSVVRVRTGDLTLINLKPENNPAIEVNLETYRNYKRGLMVELIQALQLLHR